MTASVNPEVETHSSSGACLEIGRVGFPPTALENYTFLTPNVLTWGLNVYAPLEE